MPSPCPPTASPEPLTSRPTLPHTRTFIILHGQGSTAAKFAPPLLACPLSDSQTLRSAFPSAKLIFPTAPRRRSIIYNRALTHQWFDCWHIHSPEMRPELQYKGLKETSDYLHGLIRNEAELVGVKNVVLWGLSMGCAAALVAALTWEGEEAFGGVVGMCGWLPLRRALQGVLEAEQAGVEAGGEEEGDVFETSEDRVEEGVDDPVGKTIEWLREELEMPKGEVNMVLQGIPVFLGHGVEDPKVPVEMGRNAASLLKALGVNGYWKEYQGLGHWYSGEMLNDVKEFLEQLDKA